MPVPLSILDLAPLVSGGTVGVALRRSIDLVQRAERFGYARYWVAEHHFTAGVASSQPALLLGQIAAHTSRIRLGSGAVQTGHQTPLTIVEQSGLIDALCPGRFDLGLGRSGQRRANPAHRPVVLRALAVIRPVAFRAFAVIRPVAFRAFALLRPIVFRAFAVVGPIAFRGLAAGRAAVVRVLTAGLAQAGSDRGRSPHPGAVPLRAAARLRTVRALRAPASAAGRRAARPARRPRRHPGAAGRHRHRRRRQRGARRPR